MENTFKSVLAAPRSDEQTSNITAKVNDHIYWAVVSRGVPWSGMTQTGIVCSESECSKAGKRKVILGCCTLSAPPFRAECSLMKGFRGELDSRSGSRFGHQDTLGKTQGKSHNWERAGSHPVY